MKKSQYWGVENTLVSNVDIKHAKSIVSRSMTNNLSSEDMELLKEYAVPGDEYVDVAKKYLAKLIQCKENPYAFLLSNGLMFEVHDSFSAIPNCFIRTSLFAPRKRKKRDIFNKFQLEQFGDWSVFYSGVELEQSDLDVLLMITKVFSKASAQGLVEKISSEKWKVEYSRIQFCRNSFLMSLKRSGGGSNYKWLEASLYRLTGDIEIRYQDIIKITGHIIGKLFIDEVTNKMIVDINQEYCSLFSNNQFTLIDMSQRLLLKRSFAKWLHCFISSHTNKEVLTYSAGKLMRYSGCKSKISSSFAFTARVAH